MKENKEEKTDLGGDRRRDQVSVRWMDKFVLRWLVFAKEDAQCS